MRWAYNFDGVDDRGALASRAINPDGDNAFEFYSSTVSGFQTVLSQNISNVSASKEFQLVVAATGLIVIFGGTSTSLMTPAQGFKPITRYGLTLIGSTAQVFAGGLGGTLVRSTAFIKGAAREPAAVTKISAAGASNIDMFQGLQYAIKINGTLWTMADRNQPIQLPYPTGLGAELITQSVVENPLIKGVQWTYLGNGRWQYLGDGQGELQFLNTAGLPDTGMIEYDVESYEQISGSGGMRISPTIAPTTFIGDRLFSTVGHKRAYYTVKPASMAFTRNNSGDIINCVIKNISVKPLNTCNPLNLVNTTPDRWKAVEL